MSDFILYYDILELIVEYSKDLGKRSEEYGESLEKKIIAAIENVTGGSSGNLINASNSVSEKIKVLKQKSEDFHQFAVKISTLLEVAQQTDQEVADAIAIQRDNFLGHHKSLRIENWKEKLLALLVDFEISSSLLAVISEVLDALPDIFKSLEGTIRDWYKSAEGRAISTGTPVDTGTVGIPGWMPAYGNKKFPVSKNGKGIGNLDLNDTILKWYEYPGIVGNGSTKNTATEKPKYTIGPATGDYVPVPDYPQLGPTAAFALGFDSATGGMVVGVMNVVNTLIGKPLITKEVIDYNKKNTYDFAERYKMAQVVGIGSVAYAMAAGATEGAIMKEVPEGSGKLFSNGKLDVNNTEALKQTFKGKTANEIADMLRAEGYNVTIKNSTRSSSGAQIITINNKGEGRNIMQVQVSPGGGRHGESPYVKISTDSGKIKIIDGPSSTYKTDGTEKATNIFTEGD